VVYQRTVSFIGGADQDPPETVTPELDEDPTEVEDDPRPEVVPVDVEVVPDDVDVLAVAPVEVATVPGIV
jgi:hypothetical protein